MSYFTEVKVVDRVTRTSAKVNATGQIEVTQRDSSGNEIPSGRANNPLTTVSLSEAQVKAGKHFNISGYDTALAFEGKVEYVLKTPDTEERTYLQLQIQARSLVQVGVFEDAEDVVGGTSISPVNNNRDSDNVSSLEVVKDPDSITEGDLIVGYLAGIGNEARLSPGLVLKQNTAYLIRITSQQAVNPVSWQISWHEYTG